MSKFKLGYVIWDDGSVVRCCYVIDSKDKKHAYVFDGEKVWWVERDYVFDKIPSKQQLIKEHIKILKERILQRKRSLKTYIQEEEDERSSLQKTIEVKEDIMKDLERMEKDLKKLEGEK